MELATAVKLIEKGVVQTGHPQVWADLGAGHGLFTKALAALLPPDSAVHAVDKNTNSLSTISSTGTVIIKKINEDFTDLNSFPVSLHGVIMANSLHFVEDKMAFITSLKRNLKESGRIIVVEYELERANQWVPYPILYAAMQKMAIDTGFSIIKMEEVPSVYNKANLYSCILILP